MSQPDPLTLNALANFGVSSEPPLLSWEQAREAFHLFLPHCRFVKTLPQGATVLDVGAGDGGLAAYRFWPTPARPDLRLFAWSGTKDPGFAQYDGFEVGRWPEQPPNFDGMLFDAIVSVNFLEHIDGPIQFVEWAASRLSPRGSIFLEWPDPSSTRLPSRRELAARGLHVACGTYCDGEEHRAQVPPLAAVRRVLIGTGFDIHETAIMRVPFVDEQLAIHARAKRDLPAITWAYWSHTGFCQYVVARRAASSSRVVTRASARAAKAAGGNSWAGYFAVRASPQSLSNASAWADQDRVP